MIRRATILTTSALLCHRPDQRSRSRNRRNECPTKRARKCKIHTTKFLDVGDVAGHQASSFEIYRTFPTNAPVVHGLKIKETWTRGVSDYVDNNGPGSIYTVYAFENGDKLFTRGPVLAHSGGPGTLSGTTVSYITGGTGTLANIRGIARTTGHADPKAGMNET
ncbi:hypothetical protein [Bradyrhizobium sp. USDA 3458]|uniref:hypothetical protein n=1 Tax=Bradyrhizobium sp. USDA 3458 TaxID=2591461 RepID=UPI001144E84A|nr:hypothetical protein [Bradyrhizobium sp. USDA 3458]